MRTNETEHSEPHQAFLDSMNIGYSGWRDGDGYDLDALRASTEPERETAVAMLDERLAATPNWRDVEALAVIGTPLARAAIRGAMSHADSETRLRAAEVLADLGEPADLERVIIEVLRTSDLSNGLSRAIDLAEQNPTPRIQSALVDLASIQTAAGTGPRRNLKAYQQMLAVANQLHEIDPEDQQAKADFAVALTRVAAVTPGPESAKRISMLRESLRLQREIQKVNPQNALNRWDLTHGYWLLGDALMASDRDGAVHAYRESITLGEGLINAGVYLPVRDLVSGHQRLAVISAHGRDRVAALSHATRALEIADPATPIAKGREEIVQRFLTPLGSGAMGLTYAALSRSRTSAPEVAQEDRRLARDWLKKSLAAWREVESDPAFAPSHREEWQHVKIAAKEMDRLQ